MSDQQIKTLAFPNGERITADETNVLFGTTLPRFTNIEIKDGWYECRYIGLLVLSINAQHILYVEYK